MNRFINAGIHFFILYLIYRELRFHFRHEEVTTRWRARGKSQDHDFERLMDQPETKLGQSKEFLVKISV